MKTHILLENGLSTPFLYSQKIFKEILEKQLTFTGLYVILYVQTGGIIYDRQNNSSRSDESEELYLCIAQLKRASNVSEMFRSSNIRIDNFVRLLNAMGYEVIVKDRTAGSKESWKVSLNDGDADK